MNKIWFYMMMASLCVLLVKNPSSVVSEMISASSKSLTLCIELCGIYAIWMGFLELIDKSGLGEKLAKLLRPIIRKLFKTKDPEVEKLITLNISSNMLGLGNAATPSAIKAIKKMDDGTGYATAGIIMLLVINASSLQLLPSTLISLRSSAGSTSAADIILPTLIASFITTALAIILTLICNKIREAKKK